TASRLPERSVPRAPRSRNTASDDSCAYSHAPVFNIAKTEDVVHNYLFVNATDVHYGQSVWHTASVRRSTQGGLAMGSAGEWAPHDTAGWHNLSGGATIEQTSTNLHRLR